ncbi:hypothetical protein BJF78_13630 [Pseudonocardia sp. CNS-139]|nr:hypothetical protein BJF78_13630 [Pseudonocardia sp. CNS-139]
MRGSRAGASPGRRAGGELVDGVLLVAGLGGLLVVVTGPFDGLPAAVTAVLCALAAGSLAGWLRRPGTRVVGAVLRASRTGATVAAVLLLAAAFTAASYLVAVRPGQVDATTAGLVLLAFPLMMGLTGPVAGRLADRFGARPVAVAGAVVAATGFGLLASTGAGGEPLDVAWRLAVAGIGTGLYGGPTQLLVVTAAPRERIATAGAAVQSARSLGFAVGPAAAALAWNDDGTRLHTGPAFVAVTAAAVVAAVLLVPRAGRRPARPPAEEDR